MQSLSLTAIRDRVATLSTRALVHAVGTLGVAVLVLWGFANAPARRALVQAQHDAQFRTAVTPDLLVHLGLSLCLWIALCKLRALMRARRAAAMRPQPVKLRSTRRGTVMIETLVALPVLLMLIFGIAQLSINNMAGIFTNLATFQAARSAWLWESEPCNSIECDATERARIQAAAVLTPVAPGGLQVSSESMNPAVRQMRGTLVGVQHPDMAPDGGWQGMQMASSAADQDGAQGTSMSTAVDSGSFSARTARKFTFAYHATSVQIANSGADTIRVELTYRHHAAMPLVGRIFGEPGQVAGRSGYYSSIKRVFELERLPRPNREAVVDPDSRRLY